MHLCMNTINTITGGTITTSDTARAEVNMCGSNNAITGLTITGSGQSYTGFNMPVDGYSDSGRAITTIY